MSDIQNYRRGSVIFRQGDDGDCLYSILSGRVGIYYDHGGPNEKLLAELGPDDFFGEMGLLDHAPRSATAVALEKDTSLQAVKEEDFLAFFRKNPAKILMLMQQMSSRLRATTQDYLEACRTVHETVEAEKGGQKKSGSLLDRIRKFCGIYSENVISPDMWQASSFYFDDFNI